MREVIVCAAWGGVGGGAVGATGSLWLGAAVGVVAAVVAALGWIEARGDLDRANSHIAELRQALGGDTRPAWYSAEGLRPMEEQP